MNTKNLIENYYKAFNEKKIDKMIDLLAEDVIHDTNQGERTRTKNDFISFMSDMDIYYEEELKNFSILVSTDEKRASAEFTCYGTYKKSAPGLPPARGQKYILLVGCFFEVINGKIARITNYYNLQDWLKQVNS
ncbi:MAG: ketosteroid isomerase-related protein [Bacteriovoracaceae bacterium]